MRPYVVCQDTDLFYNFIFAYKEKVDIILGVSYETCQLTIWTTWQFENCNFLIVSQSESATTQNWMHKVHRG